MPPFPENDLQPIPGVHPVMETLRHPHARVRMLWVAEGGKEGRLDEIVRAAVKRLHLQAGG